MKVVPWKPFGELGTVRKEMDRLWERFLAEGPFRSRLPEQWEPSVDLAETKDKIIVTAELPGLDAKDVSVSLMGDLLTIKGEKKKETEEKDEHTHIIERYYGAFERSFRLPENVQADKIEANFEKGILKVTLPKTEESKKKEISINVK